MPKPARYLKRMLFFLSVILLGAILFAHSLYDFFLANPFLNGAIFAILLFGIFYQFRQVLSLNPEIAYIQNLKREGNVVGSNSAQLHLLTPLQSMIREEKGHLRLSALSLRTILDSVAARLDEDRELSRYLIRILIFFGLLGTFWGLLETIQSVGKVINTLPSSDTNTALQFNDLKDNLKAPLGGMGTGFSSSLFGLAGSLILGFLDLQAGQAQNRFYNNLEDWLSTQTKITSGRNFGENESIPSYLTALVEKTSDSLDLLSQQLLQEDQNRRSLDVKLLTLTDRLTLLSDQMQTEQTLLLRLAENQKDLRPILKGLSEFLSTNHGPFDESTKTHIRNLDLCLQRLLEDHSRNKEHIINEVKSELRLMTKTLAQYQGEHSQKIMN